MEAEDTYLLRTMYQMTEQITAAVAGRSEEWFLASVPLQSAVVVKLLTIANCAQSLAPQTVQALPLVGGRAVDELRRAIADNNDTVNIEQVWRIGQQDIPQLALTLAGWLAPKP